MECVCYVENPEASVAGKLVCSCGYLKDHHSGEAISHGYRQEGNKWIYERHVRQVPTDAFGDIVFEGQRNGKYVRVSSGTAPATLYELMTKQWGLNPPHLLISVTGGAKNFYLKPSLRNLFCRGLIKVAKSTGAWIITGGSHAGVMKHVGEAVRRYTMTSSSKEGEVVAIGVATWGIVHNRECLINKEGMFPVEYTLDEENQGRLSCLDHNHSHFILVDDGTHGKYGVEILLRSNLEKYISKQRMGTEDVGIETPIICVVLEGGEGTLNTIHSAMMNGMPCVIVEGSGRAADVLASVANLPVSQITISLMQKQLRTFFSETFNTFSDRRIISWTKKVQIRMHQLLTVFKAEKARNQELDVAILQALLKASSNASHLGKENLEHQLKLAVAWDRVDIAKSEIFTDKKRWKSSNLHQAMFAALVGNKPGFVELFLENGVNLGEFVTPEILERLYNNVPQSTLLYKKLRKAVEGERRRDASDNVDAKQRILLHHVSEPARDLFLWAILQKRKMLANILWVQCYRKDPKRAQKLLIRVSNAWGNTTCLRLAIEGDDQNFMAQGGVQAILYFSDIWNKLDVAAILVFLVGLACRWISETFYYGRIILCLDFIIYCFRVMHIFAVNKTLGPKIIMVKRMMKDIFFFLFLLALSIVAFGVAKQGILIHNEDRLDWIFQGVVYHPYRMIFGEIPIDVGFSGFDLNQCTLTGSDPYKPKCPEHDSNNNPIFPEWITVILLCIYLLFTNILLLNLLIAMFNYTFQLVQENTDKIWKFQRCHLIEEYHSRLFFPSAFLPVEKRLEEEEDFALLLWEGIMKENYLAKSIHKMGQSTEQQIRSTADKCVTVGKGFVTR
uniref:Transient receptor potential cation channel, subfamily M, member 2 n=1 Tax=Callorhinchus milii TaxID=7868 RepID=A0A4W3HMS9_CALMI